MDDFERIVNARVDMIQSLQAAIIEAGGSYSSWEQLKKLRVQELIARLGQNNIRFIFKGKEE